MNQSTNQDRHKATHMQLLPLEISYVWELPGWELYPGCDAVGDRLHAWVVLHVRNIVYRGLVMMLFWVTRVFTIHHAGIAGEGSVMERRGDQKLLVGPRKDVRCHHQGHYHQSKNKATSLPPFEAQKPGPALVPLGPYLKNSKQVHWLTVHTEHNFVLSFARGALLETAMARASSAADLLFVHVAGQQLYAAVNAVPHGNALGLLAHRAMGEPPRSPGACNSCWRAFQDVLGFHKMVGRHEQQKQT